MKCTICKKPILLHTIATRKDGGRSLNRLPGRPRTRCERCQQAYRKVRAYMTRQQKRMLHKLTDT